MIEKRVMFNILGLITIIPMIYYLRLSDLRFVHCALLMYLFFKAARVENDKLKRLATGVDKRIK